ncbi:MAG: helix-hairpin-helix domain-containing protein [Pseudomonadota bacterium]|nr:helix-hairpin-helix domain-containing protein [Pseudomonadota bacterium]
MKKLLLLVITFAFCGFAYAVDINTASQKELEGVKGIGPVKAKAIIDYRNKNGAFKSVEDLANVKGMDAKSVGKMKGELTAGGAGKTMSPVEASKKADETMSKDAPRKPAAAGKKDPVEASKKADKTLSEDATRPLHDKEAKPGPVEKSGPASGRKADETMSQPSPRKPANPDPARAQ